MKVLVTGGCGFIGSHFVELLLANGYKVLDALTYAGKEENVEKINESYTFIHGDICDEKTVKTIYRAFRPDFVVNLAAETHVDNSIVDDKDFIRTNVEGTRVLLRSALGAGSVKKFVQVSTDEVYGSLPLDTLETKHSPFTESSKIDPSSSYSASKAAAEFLTFSYYKTFGLPVVVTRCCNNYGPRQDLEKFIPTIIKRILDGHPIPVYGKGLNVREWIYVKDHVEALLNALSGKPGEAYNIGSGVELCNIHMVKEIIGIMERGKYEFVPDRLGHDLRYALDSSKARKEFDWSPKWPLWRGLKETVRSHPENKCIN